jgi:hypothetical protein
MTVRFGENDRAMRFRLLFPRVWAGVGAIQPDSIYIARGRYSPHGNEARTGARADGLERLQDRQQSCLVGVPSRHRTKPPRLRN